MSEIDKSTELIFNLILEEACKSDEKLISTNEVSEKAEEIGYRVFKRVVSRLLEERDKRIAEFENKLIKVEEKCKDLDHEAQGLLQNQADFDAIFGAGAALNRASALHHAIDKIREAME